MSREQEYFPPQGSKYKWGSKALNYSPWVCDLARQIRPGLHPLDVMLYVDLVDGKYVWRMRGTDWTYGQHEKKGSNKSALKALQSAEAAGEKFFHERMPDWVCTALEHGWRPPYHES